MLQIFRKHATSWLIKVALFAIVIVFIFWGGYSYRSQKASRIARVDDHYITIAEHQQAYDQLLQNYRQRFGNQLSPELLNRLNLKQQALNMLIDRTLVIKAAGEMGIEATTAEVQQQIATYPAFQRDGQFDHERYLLLLRQNHMSPEQFEQQLHQDLTIAKIEQFIRSQALVTRETVAAQVLFDHAQIQVGYARLQPSAFQPKTAADDAAIKAFYEQHQDRYMEPVKRRFAWVAFKSADHVAEVQVDPAAIAAYHSEHPDEFHQQKEVRARHILFRLAEDALADEVAKVQAAADAVLAEAKREGADFAELAQKHSQDPAAAKGGDLGFFTHERMVPAFADAAFAMKVGEVSELVRTQFGFHIIKVEEIREETTRSLEQATAEIETKLKNDKARDIAYGKARDFADVALAEGDVGKAAAVEKLSLEAPDTWIPERGPLPGIDPDPKLLGALFGLNEGEVSPVLEWAGGYLVAQVKGLKAAEPSPLEAVKDRIAQDLKVDQGLQAAEKAAADLLDTAKSGAGLKQAATAAGLEYLESDWFSRKKPSTTLRLFGEASDQVFALNSSRVFPEKPIKLGNDLVVCEFLGKQDPSPDDQERARPETEKQILAMKQQQLWQAWIEQQKSKGKVEILQEL